MNRFVIVFLAGIIATAGPAVAGTTPSATVFEDSALCIREPHLTENFAGQFRELQPTNAVGGTILDLRFADGDDSAVAAALKFLSVQHRPLVILINSQTRGGAAELAARLRTARLGIVIGSTNVAGPVTPDIAVTVSADDERQFLTNPFAKPTGNGTTGTNSELMSFVDHLTEADLVRKRIKDGEDPGEEEVTPRPAPTEPVICDPALARAVDLIKSLGLLKRAHD